MEGSSSAAPKGRKRASDKTDPPKSKQAKKTKQSNAEASTSQDDPRPRLTTPDLEYDYDRSQLRDQRPTPGRKNRPRLGTFKIDNEFKQRFYIPTPERPKGMSKNDDRWYAMQALADPTFTFHDLHVCHKKGANGSPTYDQAGFQLDYHKVDQWMKPRPYNKQRMVRGMNRAVDEMEMERQAMFKSFFVDGRPPEAAAHIVEDHVKDHVSKDLGIPWHQINAAWLAEWEQKGFAKVDAAEWWRVPNAEEKKRMDNMMMGASLRKDL
ncbi:hypothetical protein ACJ41O_014365 [Fusarium nematophilum]